jgi:hypothetical protein
MAVEFGSLFNGSVPYSDTGGGDVRPQFSDNYRANLYVLRDGAEVLRISTPLPENFAFNLASSWDNPFNQPLTNFVSSASGGRMGRAVDVATTGVQAATGFTSLNKWLSGGVWTGGSMMKLDIPFVIQAFEDPLTEVVQVMRDLMKLVAPSEYAGNFLRAPGPRMGNPVTGEVNGDIIIVEIGSFFTMYPCIVDNVSETFDTQFDANGNPISTTINVSIISYFTTTQEDLDKFFAPAFGG